MKMLKAKKNKGKSAAHFGMAGGPQRSLTEWYRSHRTVAVAGSALVIVALAVIVPAAIYRSMAATGSTSYEAENGSPAGKVSVQNDSNASGGRFLQFGLASSGGSQVMGGDDTTCQFQKADKPTHVAFCESFGKKYTNDPAVNRSGQLQNQLWGISRANSSVNTGQGQYNDYYPAHLTGCGATQVVLPNNDVQACADGRMHEAVNDGGGEHRPSNSLTELAIYPKQPFDIAGGRTGTIVFDVSANSEGPHAAWPEFWWTDQPVPAPGDARSTWKTYARNSFGVVFAQNCPDGYTGIDHIAMTSNYTLTNLSSNHDPGQPGYDVPNPWDPVAQGCVKRGNPTTGLMNHVEIRISQNHFEVWMSDAGSTTLKELAVSQNFTSPLTRGVVWAQDVHYNACKFDTQCDHDFAWDNIGFDGPGLYRDLSFDVPDANIPGEDEIRDETTGAVIATLPNVRLGYKLDPNVAKSFTIKNVFQLQTPTSAIVTLNWLPTNTKAVPSVSVNGNTFINTPWPFPAEEGDTYCWRTIAVSVPLSQIKTDGSDNTVQLKYPEDVVVSNTNLILIAGSPVPASLQ